MKESTYLKGALYITLGNFTAKIVGALTRIPLNALLGAEGVGLYQLVYPFYTLLLTVSSAGLPSALSKMIAEKRRLGFSGEEVTDGAIKLFLLLGMVGTFCMMALSYPLSILQGERLISAYFALAPAVACVAVLAVLRGHFQGKSDMFPTAMTEVIEQVFKGSFALVLAYLFRADVVKAVTAVLFAVSVSEGVALVWIYARYKGEKRAKPLLFQPLMQGKDILPTTLPVAVLAGVLPLTQFAVGALSVRLLKRHSKEALRLFGLYSGGAVTVVGLAVSLCYGFAVALIPRITPGHARDKDKKALYLTLGVAALCAAGTYIFAPLLARVFFFRESAEHLKTLTVLIRLLSPTAITHAGFQTLSGCLIARDRALISARNVLFGGILELVAIFLLVPLQNISVYGAAVGANVCYFTAFVLNLKSNFYTEKRVYDHDHRIGRRGRRSDRARKAGYPLGG